MVIMTWMAFLPGFISADLVDRILAVVNDEVVTLSDVNIYQTFFGEDQNAQIILEKIIDQKLLLAEAKKFRLSEPSSEIVDAAYQEQITRFGTQEALKNKLTKIGFSTDDLRKMILRRLIVSDLIDQRVNLFVFVSAMEVQRYYEAHSEDFPDQTIEEVRAVIQKRLERQKTEVKRKEYFNRLRSNATIVIN